LRNSLTRVDPGQGQVLIRRASKAIEENVRKAIEGFDWEMRVF
jgi:hypothetical protein